MSLITSSVSLTSLISRYGTEGLSILHREGKVTEEMLIQLAPWLGTIGLENLDMFIQDAFPIVDSILWKEQNQLGNFQGNNQFPNLEGEIEYTADLHWWFGILSSNQILDFIKEEYNAFAFYTSQCYLEIDECYYKDYLEVLTELLNLVEVYDKPSIEEEMEGLLDKMKPKEEPTGKSFYWLKDW
jgi:hypothetical protein